MVITRKIEKSSEELCNEIIDRGGAVIEDKSQKLVPKKSMVLRVPIDWLEKMDKSIKKTCGLNRTSWILQAIAEKIERENGKNI